MKKISKIVLSVVLVMLAAVSLISIAFSLIGMREIENLKAQIEGEAEENRNEDEENILIGGEYQILSTKSISDAYISKDSSKLNDEDKKTLEIASGIFEEIVNDNMSDYEKEKAIYEWICENIKHDEGSTAAVPEARGIVDRPFGVLQNKEAVCVGYATTFRLLTNMAGLDCMVMHDNGEGHSWNIVKLDDNCWYIVDCYMDAENMSPLYSNFNMDEEAANESHDWDAALYPAANGTKYNYMLMNLKRVSDPVDIIKLMAEYKEKGIKLAYMQVPVDEKNVNENIVSYIVDGISMRETYENGYTSMNILYREDSIIVVYTYTDYEDDDENAGDVYIEDIDYEKIDEKLDKLFGPIDEENNFKY